jgi:anti-anti-sigma regulatory factor
MSDLERTTVEWVSDVAVAPPRDREPRDEEVTALRAGFRRLLALPGCRHVAIDFRDAEFFEASLRGVLVRVCRELRDRGGRLALCGRPPGLRQRPTIEQFGSFLTIVDRLEDALTAPLPPEAEGVG